MDDDIDRRRLLDETDDTGTTSPNSSFVGIASESRHGIDAADMVEPVLAPATERSAVARHYPPHHHHHHGTTKSGSGLVNESQTEMTSVDIFGCTHQWVVALFFTMSFFTYFDRGALSAALDHIQKQLLNDSSFKGGCLASSYLFGYCLSSPVFALLGAKFAPLKMSGLGMLTWASGCALTGFLSNFYLLILARLLTGIGEASFLAFSSTIIDVAAPHESRAFWLGLFFMAISFGYAIGYAGGGEMVSSNIYHSDGDNQSWRFVFILESLIMIPFAVYLLVMRGPKNMGELKALKKTVTDPKDIDMSTQSKAGLDKDDAVAKEHWKIKVWRVVSNKTWLCCTMGYSMQTFVTGAFAILAIEYMEKVYDMGAGTAGSIFGSMTLVAGLVGSVIGGALLDKLKSRVPSDSPDHFFLKPTMKLLMWCSLLAWPFSTAAFLFDSIAMFCVFVFIAEFIIFLSMGPANNAILWCVDFHSRPLAAALNTFCLHMFGDALAPVLLGGVVSSMEAGGSSTRSAWNTTMLIGSFWLIFSGLFYFMGKFTLRGLCKLLEAPKAKPMDSGFFDEE